MQEEEINELLQQHFPGAVKTADPDVKQFSSSLANASQSVKRLVGESTLSDHRQPCYAKCQKTRDVALAAAAKKGWPLAAAAAAAAIMQFNACRHECDEHP